MSLFFPFTQPLLNHSLFGEAYPEDFIQNGPLAFLAACSVFFYSSALVTTRETKYFFSHLLSISFYYCCCCCFAVAQLCLTLCNLVHCSMPGFPVLHHLLEFAQTPVHWVGDIIQLVWSTCCPKDSQESFLGSAGKESACNAGDLGSIPGLGRSPGEGKGYPLQYSGLENSMDCIVHGVTKSWTWLSDFHFHFLAPQFERTLQSPGFLRAGFLSGLFIVIFTAPRTELGAEYLLCKYLLNEWKEQWQWG